ncbi:MAG: hypothetical protein AAFV88_04380 [Planctomycetota bacterium]
MSFTSLPIANIQYGSYHWLAQEIGHSLGLGIDYTQWNSTEVARVESILQSGVMQAYFPPPLQQISESDDEETRKDDRKRKPHTWSFLNQMGTLETLANVTEYQLPEGFSGSHGDLVITSGEGRVPIVAEEHLRSLLAADVDVVTPQAGGAYDPTRDVFYPENYGAIGDGSTNDTAAFEAMLLAAITRGNVTGSASIVMRGNYLLDEIDRVSHYAANGDFPRVTCDLWFDAKGANFTHTGTGNGIFTFEGDKDSQMRFHWEGGHATGNSTANSKWFIAGRDIRGSYLHPAELETFEYGLLLMIWRSWSENNSIGDTGNPIFGRRCGHIYGMKGREQAWSFILGLQGQNLPGTQYQGELASDPGSPSNNDWYWNTVDNRIRQYQTSAWVNILSIADVDDSVSGNSYARTNIGRTTIGGADDTTSDGLIVHIDGASLYDSTIHQLRGNVDNNGGSLVYLNDNYNLHTVIEDIGCEKGNVSGNPVGYVIRTGPNYETATQTPLCRNVRWTGGFALPTDPSAGILIDGEWGLVDTDGSNPTIVLYAGTANTNSTVIITVKDHSAAVLSRALVGYRNANLNSPSIEVSENRGSLVTWGSDGSNNITIATASATSNIRVHHEIIRA